LVLSPFLKIGQTKADLISAGKTPSLSDLLTMQVREDISNGQYFFNMWIGMLKGPEDLPVLNFLMISLSRSWWLHR
jgi:hypothetical protein